MIPKIVICKEAKRASIVTMVTMLLFRTFYPGLMIFVPLGILTFLFLSYPRCEKVGIVGMMIRMQAMYVVTLVAIILILIER